MKASEVQYQENKHSHLEVKLRVLEDKKYEAQFQAKKWPNFPQCFRCFVSSKSEELEELYGQATRAQ